MTLAVAIGALVLLFALMVWQDVWLRREYDELCACLDRVVARSLFQEPTSPGALIRNQLVLLGWTPEDLCEATGWTRGFVDGLLNGETIIDTEEADRLSELVGFSPALWLELERLHRESKA